MQYLSLLITSGTIVIEWRSNLVMLKNSTIEIESLTKLPSERFSIFLIMLKI